MATFPRYTLDKGQAFVANAVGRWRYDSNRDAAVKSQQVGPQPALEIDVNGAGAELALSWMLNIAPDLTIQPRKGGADCISAKGKRIDVKVTAHRDGRLIAKQTKKREYADIYVLLVGSFPGPYTWVGWATAEELIREENLIDLGYGPTYALEQSALHRPVLPDYLPEGWLS